MELQLNEVTREIILQMLLSEQKLRYSNDVQNLYDQGLNSTNDPEFIEKFIQKKVLEQFGFNTSDGSLKNYQSIGSYYENDTEIKNAIHYLRINIIKDCSLKMYQPCIDANLYTLDNKPIKLSHYYNQDKPLVILAGSIT